jgi:hypothetical protein
MSGKKYFELLARVKYLEEQLDTGEEVWEREKKLYEDKICELEWDKYNLKEELKSLLNPTP